MLLINAGDLYDTEKDFIELSISRALLEKIYFSYADNCKNIAETLDVCVEEMERKIRELIIEEEEDVFKVGDKVEFSIEISDTLLESLKMCNLHRDYYTVEEYDRKNNRVLTTNKLSINANWLRKIEK